MYLLAWTPFSQDQPVIGLIWSQSFSHPQSKPWAQSREKVGVAVTYWVGGCTNGKERDRNLGTCSLPESCLLSPWRILRVFRPRFHAPSRCQHPHRESELTPGQQQQQHGETGHFSWGAPGATLDVVGKWRNQGKEENSWPPLSASLAGRQPRLHKFIGVQGKGSSQSMCVGIDKQLEWVPWKSQNPCTLALSSHSVSGPDSPDNLWKPEDAEPRA